MTANRLCNFNIRLRLLAFACAIGFFAIGSEAHAKTIYVSPAGNDNNPGTIERPVATPRQAIEMISPGDTVYFRAGRYRINRFLWVDKERVTISSYPGERAAIWGGTDESADNPTSIFILAASNISLVNLDIEGSSYYGVKVDVDKTPATAGVAIRGCRIKGTGRDGIKTFNADNLLIEDCEIGPTGVRDPSNAEGIDSIGSVGVAIRRCYIRDAATNAVYLKGGARDGIIEQCRIERAGHAGILLGQDTDLEYMRDGARHEAINCAARNNLVIGTEAAGVGAYSARDVRFENNTLYDVARKNQAGLWVVINSREVPSERVTFRNNIVVSGARPMIFLRDLADPIVCDSNIYFSIRGECEFRRETSAGQYDAWSFAAWKQKMKADLRSQVADPLLDAGDLYRPRPSSPAIDRGEALPYVKSDYSGTARPAGNGYDIGAHESSFIRESHMPNPNDVELASPRASQDQSVARGYIGLKTVAGLGALSVALYPLVIAICSDATAEETN